MVNGVGDNRRMMQRITDDNQPRTGHNVREGEDKERVKGGGYREAELCADLRW